MMPIRSYLLISMFIALGTYTAARANIVDCKPPENVPYIANLNELDYDSKVFKSKAEMLTFFNRLYDHLDQKRDREMAGLGTIPFRVARCAGRKPKPDGSDFSAPLVERLLNENVVIEIWGQLADRHLDGRAVPSAQMNYLVLPIRRATDGGSVQVPSHHRFNYPDRGINSKDYVALISNQDLYAFLNAAIGTRLFENDRFVQAIQFLCKAGATLGTIGVQLARIENTKAQSKSINDLRTHVLTLARKARSSVSAVADKQASASARLLELDDPCGGAGGAP